MCRHQAAKDGPDSGQTASGGERVGQSDVQHIFPDNSCASTTLTPYEASLDRLDLSLGHWPA